MGGGVFLQKTLLPKKLIWKYRKMYTSIRAMTICNEIGCEKNALYNLVGEPAKYCRIHKLENMKDVITHICIENNCSLRASFNILGEKKKLYCSSHRKEGMVDIAHKRCSHNGCELLSPSFNFVGEKKGLYCSEHQHEGMVSVILKKRCLHENCEILPLFNIRGKTVGGYCYAHRTDEMINVVSQRCNHENCENIKPIYNFKGQTIGKYCAIHKIDGMINVVSKRCSHENCEIVCPVFNFKGNSVGKFCATHKLTGMINIKSPRCCHENCESICPVFNMRGQTMGRFCSIHKLTNMIDVRHKRCMTHLCETQINNKQYRGLCQRCFVYSFPDEPVSRNYKTKERSVTDYVIENFPSVSWVCDKTIQDGCSKKRPDIRCDFGSHIVIIEIDENHHSLYDCSCENRRVMEISQDIGHRPIVFIRFNPDTYTDTNGNKITSCWGTNKYGILTIKPTKKDEWQERIRLLHEQIQYWIDNVPDKIVETIQLFY